MNDYFFTSEAVTEGHPDKICDQISDAILDEALRQDRESKMAVECTIKDDIVFIYGEANTRAKINYSDIALQTIAAIGYRENYNVFVKVSKQSREIAQAVNQKEQGAGDQGIMFGFACNETENYMPLSIELANKLAMKLDLCRHMYECPGLRPDGKTQVTVEYRNGKINRIDTIVISAQHEEWLSQDKLQVMIYDKIVTPTIPKNLITKNTKIIINPSGSFIVGGSFGDSGTTGRKIVCDTYGGHGRIGGGALSSKDPSKVDRSGAYYARYVTKNIVANGFADKCEIQVSYAIGVSRPISICFECFGTQKISDKAMNDCINKFDFSPANIIKELNLKRPIYRATSCYGHFGKRDLPWEKIKSL